MLSIDRVFPHSHACPLVIESPYAELDMTSLNEHGLTPLGEAVFENDLDKVADFLAHGADVDVIQLHGVTPLFIAVEHGLLDMVALLLKNHASVTTVSRDEQYTPLHLATCLGFVDIVKIFTYREETDLNARDNKGTTPLMIALEIGHVELTKFLLIQGADPTKKEFSLGLTPLHRAVLSQDPALIELIVNALIDWKTRNSDQNPFTRRDYTQKTAYDLAVTLGAPKLLEKLPVVWCYPDSMKFGAHRYLDPVVRALTSTGWEEKLRKEISKTILKELIKVNYLSFINNSIFFLIVEPEPSSLDPTALGISRDQLETAKTTLLDLLAEFDAGEEPFYIDSLLFDAIYDHHVPGSLYYMDHMFFQINAQNEYLQTPLHATNLPYFYSGEEEITTSYTLAKALLERGANTEILGLDSEIPKAYTTPLQAAVKSNNYPLVQLLLTHGASLETRSRKALFNKKTGLYSVGESDMNTALHWAMIFLGQLQDRIEDEGDEEGQGFLAIANLLLTSGANPLTKNADGLTPMDLVTRFRPSHEHKGNARDLLTVYLPAEV